MKIKKSKQLQPGDVIDYERISYAEVTPLCNTNHKYKPTKCKLLCIQVFDHHVLFRTLEQPNLKVDIQNTDLWKNGIYKKEDILIPFAENVIDL